MPRDYGGGPGLKTGSSWGGTMASGNAGGFADAYGTRNRDGSVSWNGINGNGSYTGYGDYYSAGIPRQAYNPQGASVVPTAVVNPVPKPKPIMHPVVRPAVPAMPASKFYGPKYGPQLPNMTGNYDYQVPGGYGHTAFGPGWASSGYHQGIAGPYGGPDPYGDRYRNNPAQDYRGDTGWAGGGFGGGPGRGW